MIKEMFGKRDKDMEKMSQELDKALEEEFGTPVEPNAEFSGPAGSSITESIQKAMDMVDADPVKPKPKPATPAEFADMSISNMEKIKQRELNRVDEKAIVIQKLKDEIVIHEKMVASCNSFINTMKGAKPKPAAKPRAKKVTKTPAPEMAPLVKQEKK